MTDRTDTAAYLEELASMLASHGSNLAALRLAALEQKVSPYLAAPGVPTRQVGTDAVASTLGNINPIAGRANLLHDPTMESLRSTSAVLGTSDTTIGASYADVAAWAAWRSNTSATCTYYRASVRASATDHYFNSGSAKLRVQPTGAGTHQAFIYSSAVDLTVSPQTALPFLVGAASFVRLDTPDVTGVTSATVRLQLISDSTSTTPSTASVDVLALAANQPIRRVAAFPTADYFPADGDQWRLQVTLEVVATGAGGDVSIVIGEPQMHFAPSPDAFPYQPALGVWEPSMVYSPSAVAATDDLLVSGLFVDSDPRYLVDAGGSTRWGGGSVAADARLYRSAAKTLTVDDTAAGAAALNVVGTIQNGGTAVVGSRKTGWGAPTGTATRTTFATDSVSLINLARAVKALIDDLTSHGLIGA